MCFWNVSLVGLIIILWRERDSGGKDESVLGFSHRNANGVTLVSAMPGFEILSEREKKVGG